MRWLFLMPTTRKLMAQSLKNKMRRVPNVMLNADFFDG